MGICGIYVRTSIETDGTSIEQQKELGIKFCKAQGFQYQVYEDVGKSGYKIEDDNDPFKNRQGLTSLIEDIEKSIIDRVWVWEQSRLSRNELASYMLRRIFAKNNILVYENGKQFDMNDPMSIMIDGILTHVSRYERNRITSRTTRGIHDRINTGRRSYKKIYGYKQIGKLDKFISWEPVKSEIENIKYAFNEFLNGKSINSIIKELHGDMTEVRLKAIHKNYRNILFRFDYTGYSLTIEGSELYYKYRNMEIDSLDFLKEKENGKPKYYVNSINYNLKLVSINDWIIVMKQLIENKQIYKMKKRYANSDIFSGIMSCPYCGLSYYSFNKDQYLYYTHVPKKKCLQRPKSAKREDINNLVELFYFYFYLVYDDTRELLKENQKIIDLNLIKIQDKITSVESDNKKIEKQISNFQNIYEDSIDKELLKLTLTKENELNIKLGNNNSIILKLKKELGDLTDEFNKDKMELTYYNVKELIIHFLEKLSVENKRVALLKIIKKCQLFGKYFLIDTGKLLFIFNISQVYKLPENIIKVFKKDKHFKDNFLNSSKVTNEEGKFTEYLEEYLEYFKNNYMKGKPNREIKGTELKSITKELTNIMSNIYNYLIVRKFGDYFIQEIFLKMKNRVDVKSIMKKRLQDVGIDYPLTNIEKIISFTII